MAGRHFVQINEIKQNFKHPAVEYPHEFSPGAHLVQNKVTYGIQGLLLLRAFIIIIFACLFVTIAEEFLRNQLYIYF